MRNAEKDKYSPAGGEVLLSPGLYEFSFVGANIVL